MKILKEGNWKNLWTGRYTCKHEGCGAELEVDENDVVAKGFKYSLHKAAAIVCVVCGHEFPIPEKDLPPRIRERLEASRPHDTSGGRD